MPQRSSVNSNPLHSLSPSKANNLPDLFLASTVIVAAGIAHSIVKCTFLSVLLLRAVAQVQLLLPQFTDA
jgi:hypothetical protein